VYEAAFDTRDRTAEVQPPADQISPLTTIEVEVRGRWDALALSELLISFHSFLVQRDRERWVVHARAPGGNGESLSDALEKIEDWRSEKGRPGAASCRVDGRLYQLPRRSGPAKERSSR
jgi:hypothetical protein